MANIQLNYLYRDGGNYKNYYSIIFTNANNISLEELSTLLKTRLIDSSWFYAEQWNLPDLKQDDFNPEIDPSWHEFENIEYTDERPNATQTLEQFLLNITIP